MNIAEYHQARLSQGGDALAVITLDGPLPPAHAMQLLTLAEVHSAMVVTLRRRIAERLGGSVGVSRRFVSVVFDVDSTLVGIEGIDWLAELRGPEVADAVRTLTRDAMAGRVPLDEVYGRRLELIAPGPAEIAALADAYLDAVAPGAADLLATTPGRPAWR